MAYRHSSGQNPVTIRFDPESLRWLPTILIALMVLGGLFSAWFTVDPEERGVVLRLGKWNRTVDPGFQFKFPYGLEKVYLVPVKRQLKYEFGFRSSRASARAGGRSQYVDTPYEQESLMLTGDLNVADVEWVTQFRITDPRNYLFKVRNQEGTFRVMNEAIMREVVGDHSINHVLTTGRKRIEDLVRQELQELSEQYEMGIIVDQVILQDVNPPDAVKPSFNEVNQAQQEKEKLINQARAEYNRVIPRARGEAARQIEEAEGYAVERVNRARGDGRHFNALFEEYSKAPEVTRQRIYLETMETILNQVGRKYIIDESTSGPLPLLNLGEELK